MIDLLNQLHKSGQLQLLYEAGLLRGKAITYREAFLYYDAQVKAGHKTYIAVEMTAKTTGVTTRQVWKIVKLLKRNDQNRNSDTLTG